MHPSVFSMPHPRGCLSNVSVLWMNMHYSSLIHSACACEQRRDEDSARTLLPGSYKTQKNQPLQSKGSDPPYFRNSPDPLRPKTSLFCSVYVSLALTLKGEPENKAQRKQTSEIGIRGIPLLLLSDLLSVQSATSLNHTKLCRGRCCVGKSLRIQGNDI